jgi:hypothetical protein
MILAVCIIRRGLDSCIRAISNFITGHGTANTVVRHRECYLHRENDISKAIISKGQYSNSVMIFRCGKFSILPWQD